MQYWRFETIYYVYGESSDQKPLHTVCVIKIRRWEDEGLQRLQVCDDFLSRLEIHTQISCVGFGYMNERTYKL